ncbi:PepSY domain-containing protein [Amedibacillus sp. YH-ame10]
MKTMRMVLLSILAMTTLFACSKAEPISKQEAMDVALKDAGVNANEVNFNKQAFDKDDNEYTFEFQSDTMSYEYDIHAGNGKIISKESKQRKQTKTDVNSSATMQSISEEQWTYVQLAADHFSIAKADIQNVRVENDSDHGVATYDIKFYVGTKEFQCEIEKDSKRIIESEIDQD